MTSALDMAAQWLCNVCTATMSLQDGCPYQMYSIVLPGACPLNILMWPHSVSKVIVQRTECMLIQPMRMTLRSAVQASKEGFGDNKTYKKAQNVFKVTTVSCVSHESMGVMTRLPYWQAVQDHEVKPLGLTLNLKASSILSSSWTS